MTVGNVNPDQMEELARRLDGETGDGGTGADLSGMFTRAATLDATSEMAPLRPLQTWLSDTAPNLRARAGYARLSDGDPTAGLRLAGFTTEDIAAFDGEVPTDALVMANSLAANGNADDESFQRGHREKIDEWLARIAGEYSEEIPGLEGHGATVEWAIRTGNDWMSFTAAATVVASAGTNMYRAARWSGFYHNAPRSWLPGQLGNFIRGNPTVNRLMQIPGQTAARIEGQVFGSAWDAARRSPLARTGVGNFTPNWLANRITGNDQIARMLGHRPGTPAAIRAQQRPNLPPRAASVRMDWVARNRYSQLRTAGGGRWASGVRAAGTTMRAGGWIRGLGVAGSAVGTGLSAANLIAQGNPVDAWNEYNTQERIGYAADWAELGFNASLTAAMIAPNPVTIGAAVVTGVIYGGLKIAENWDSITEGVGNAVDAVGEGLGDAADAVGDFVGDLF
jgi:hypothetical protein